MNACNDKRYESGGGQPHSKTWRKFVASRNARQRLGVRLSPAAFPPIANFCNKRSGRLAV